MFVSSPLLSHNPTPGRRGWTTLFKRKVAFRVWVAIALPTLVAVGALIDLNSALVVSSHSAHLMSRAADLIVEANATMAEMQTERGLTLRGLGTGDADLLSKRREQRQMTDRQRISLQTAIGKMLPELPAETAGRWQILQSGMAAIDELRAAIDSGAATLEFVTETYSKQVQQLISAQESLQKLAVTPDVSRGFVELIRAVRMRESAGLERALGARALASGDVSAATRQRLTELAVDQDVRFGVYKDLATPPQLASANQFDESSANQAFLKLRSALALGQGNGITGDAWFAAATARLVLVRQLENEQIGAIRTSSIADAAHADQQLILVTGMTILALIVGGIVVALLARSITNPIRLLTQSMNKLASGDTTITVPATGRADEIGDMGRSVLVFLQQAIAVGQLTRDAEEQRLKGEVERRIALLAMAEKVEDETRHVVTSVKAEAVRVNETAGLMAGSAMLVQQNAQMVAAAAEQSLANAQAVASASEQLSASIREIASQVARSSDIVGTTVQAAGNASATVTDLAISMAAIDQVVQLIANIASQTNLLALNATIEAARAGDAGKGFAVVANEVKNLANQTAHQTGDITQRINTLKEMAGKVSSAIADVVTQIGGVEEIAGSVAAAVEQQDAATREIARNVQESSKAAKEVSERIVEVAAEAKSSGEQAHLVEAMLGTMSENVSELEHALSRVVRTATPDVDRRTSVRIKITAHGSLAVGGVESPFDLANISEGGAALLGLPAIVAGQSCQLKLGAMQLSATVLGRAGLSTRLQFAPQHSALVKQWIDQQQSQTLAA